MSNCPECGGKPELCAVCDNYIEGECVSDSSAEPCCDGGTYCDSCFTYVHTDCYDSEGDACRTCAREAIQDARDERKEIQRCRHR